MLTATAGQWGDGRAPGLPDSAPQACCSHASIRDGIYHKGIRFPAKRAAAGILKNGGGAADDFVRDLLG